MCCDPKSLTSSRGSPVPVNRLKEETRDLKSSGNLICHLNHDKEPHAFLASENLTDPNGSCISPIQHLSLLQFENSTVPEDDTSNTLTMSLLQSDAKTDSPMSKYEDPIASLLTNEIYEAFIKYRKVIGKAIRPFIRLDPARSSEDFMQEAYIPFCKGYYYCNSEKVEKSLATNLIFNCVRHYFVDQYEDWSISHQENISKSIRNSLWKESNNLPGHCRRVNAEI